MSLHAYSDRPGDRLVMVDAEPVSLTSLWLPGLNQRPCSAQLGHYDELTARRVARDIRAAPRFPSGDMSCPNDDGSGVLCTSATGRSTALRSPVPP
jgi:hypothetical protein